MNRDEADRCFNIAKEHLQKNDYESALKYFQKSQKLENREETSSMIRQCQEHLKHKGEQQEGSSHSHHNHHHHHGHKSSHNTGATGGSSQTNTGSSAKSAELRKILGTKDFYEILGLQKTATEDEIKKSYRKLALKFHPDKNCEPGADEAFKKIAQAYDCLSNADKRRKYDEFGNEDPDQHYRHYRQYYSEDSFSPEDLFGMFFGNAFFQEGPSQRRFVYRTHRAGGQHHEGGENRQHQQARNNGNFKLLPLLQFLPLLIIILSSFAFNLQSDEPAYSLVQNYKFNVERKTFNLKISYFVDQAFQNGIGQNRKKLVTLEEGIERDFIKNLNYKCNNAKQRVYQFEQRAKNSRGATSEEYLNQARRIDLSTCEELLRIKNKFPQLVGPSYYYY